MILYPQTLKELVSNLHTDDFQHVLFLCDSNTSAHCYSRIKDALPSHITETVQAGEYSKTLESASKIWEQMVDSGFNRKSLVVNLGGGMITDLGGFAASVYQRGIPFINIPTSLLAMVDASSGGKTGINFSGLKNYIGTFSQPVSTIICPEWLRTLPHSEILNGWAEIVKHAIINGNGTWKLIENGIPDSSQMDLWFQIIQENVKIKERITAKDPFENNIRKTLNLGHTIGHSIESTETNIQTPHGIAVAAGMMIETHIAQQMQLCSTEFANTIIQYIHSFFPKIEFSFSESGSFLRALSSDKKNHSGKILMSLPVEFGNVRYDTEVSLESTMESVRWYESY